MAMDDGEVGRAIPPLPEFAPLGDCRKSQATLENTKSPKVGPRTVQDAAGKGGEVGRIV